MKKRLSSYCLLVGFIMFAAYPAFADDEEMDLAGELNPDEMSLNTSLQKALRGEVNIVVCSQGYMMTKMGKHAAARKMFEACAAKGWTGTMTWMSYMEQNGFGGEEDPQAAAAWDKKAADLGDPIGQFNHGLDLLRGYGVAQDLELGRRYIDQAAANGVKSAQELKAGDYDPEIVTPDADSWKYKQRLY